MYLLRLHVCYFATLFLNNYFHPIQMQSGNGVMITLSS